MLTVHISSDSGTQGNGVAAVIEFLGKIQYFVNNNYIVIMTYNVIDFELASNKYV